MVELVFYFISKFKKNLYIIFSLFFSFLIGTLLLKFNLNILPLGLHTAFFGIIFFGIGYLSKCFVNSLILKKSQIHIYIVFIGIILQILLTFYFSGSIQKTTFFYIPIAFVGILSYLLLSIMIKENQLLEFFGKNSLVILAFQEQSYRAIIYMFSKITSIEVETIRNNIIYCIIITILTLTVIFPIIKLYNKYIRTLINKIVN
jgi:hypothetical protein